MKKSIIKTTAGILIALFTLGTSVCTAQAATPGSAAVTTGIAEIHLHSYNSDRINSPHAGVVSQDETITAHVGDLLEISVSAQANEPAYPLICNNQTFLSFNNTENKYSKTDNNGILRFCYDYYAPDKSVPVETTPYEQMSIISNPTIFPTSFPENRNNVIYVCTGITKLIDCRKPAVLFRFVVRVEKAGACYINTLNCETESAVMPYAVGIDGMGADLHTDVKVIQSAAPQRSIGDIDNDGRISVNDITAIQRHFAELDSLSADQLTVADADGNGVFDVKDATRLQMFLAEFDVTLG